MAKGYIDAIKAIKPDAKVGSEGTDYEGIIWFDETPIDKATLDAKLAELPTEEEDIQALIDLKASAKAKLIAGEKLTEEEANVLVGV
tara:strand:- start:1126 stop:1386 length:261 start_codon:yes stop_codon:yes gene_type:complete